MRVSKLFTNLVVCLLCIISLSNANNQIAVPFDSDQWVLDPHASIIEYDGRTVLTGTAYLKNIDIFNGTIDVDIMANSKRDFGGPMFRVQSFNDFEWCYLRFHKATGYVQDAFQYAPHLNGASCWQLYGGKTGIRPVYFPKNKWVHMKVVFHGNQGKVYIDDMDKPIINIDPLQLELGSGSLGLMSWSTGNVLYSNFTYTEDTSITESPNKLPLDPCIVTGWKLSTPYKLKGLNHTEPYPINKLKNINHWIVPAIDNTGLVNITRYYGHINGTDQTYVILKTTIVSDHRQKIKLNFGYSDAATIYLNKEPLFTGNNAYTSRNMAFGGWINDKDAVYLDLKKGKNELLVVLAENFGGCGFLAKLDKIDGIKFDE